MKKLHIFFKLDTEERWINTIQAAGYRLNHVTGWLHVYTFAPLEQTTEFNPYTRIDYRNENMTRRKYDDYLQLFADSGWRLIAGSRYGGAQYFQQTTPTADRDIFSDAESRSQSRQRQLRFSILFALLFFMYSAISFSNSAYGWRGLWHVKGWYLTPGLWQMHGVHFWESFLFETPFAMLRGLPAYIFLIVGIYFLIRVLVNLPLKPAEHLE